MTDSPAQRKIVIIGGGPAGLTAGREMLKFGHHPTVVEKTPRVGGLACTVNYKGFHFDMGGHRFFTKVDEVNKIWQEVLGGEFLRRPRLSRIFYNNRFFHYPLKPFNALLGLGVWQAILVILSYLRWQIRPHRREDTFEQWVTNRFGYRLFSIFFKTYTEKVWGIPCSELRAEWAAQRIKGLSLRTVLLTMFLKPRHTIKTLIEEFDYPRLGPGMMWEAVAAEIEEKGGHVRLDSDVVRICRTADRVDAIVVARAGREETISGTDFISSMPVSELVLKLSPPVPAPVAEAARRLTYRDFLTVCLIVRKRDLFPDNWIYVHSSTVNVGRIQNFANWSPDMVPDHSKSSLGLEYFCSEGDTLWNTPDEELIAMGARELEAIGLATRADVEDGCVFRVPKAYPVYDATYADCMVRVREFVDGLENLQTVGRNGLHRYNNQDHAMLTGILAVRNLVLGERNDLWSVNTEAEYHEEVTEKALGPALDQYFPRLDRLALAGATGAAGGLLLFLATMLLVLKGGPVVGPTLGLLGQYFPGYTVTLSGGVLGLLYGFVAGGVLGWTFALLRNTVLLLYIAIVRRRVERDLLRRFLEFV
ncbi:MAG TPA: NAD(P)/FAD-dependent oxidoreductase [Methylomirabilota bacterium]|nr:NAD(P)/FAD-dependent oxidoreductase [Methylomirabilota bacterium]